jgi:hypothetical protein
MGNDFDDGSSIDDMPPSQQTSERIRSTEKLHRAEVDTINHAKDMAYAISKSSNIHITGVQYQLLKALEAAEAAGHMLTFRQLVKATGIYSGLPLNLRSRHHRSLGTKGLVREDILMIDGEKVFCFQITKEGQELLDKHEP